MTAQPRANRSAYRQSAFFVYLLTSLERRATREASFTPRLWTGQTTAGIALARDLVLRTATGTDAVATASVLVTTIIGRHRCRNLLHRPRCRATTAEPPAAPLRRRRVLGLGRALRTGDTEANTGTTAAVITAGIMTAAVAGGTDTGTTAIVLDHALPHPRRQRQAPLPRSVASTRRSLARAASSPFRSSLPSSASSGCGWPR